MSERSGFYQSHLDGVSRSFAFCIAKLPEPLREQVGLAYLLCRVLDCVEDAQWTKLDEQLHQFDQFIGFMQAHPEESAVRAWVRSFPQGGLTVEETSLLQQSSTFIQDFHLLAAPVQQAFLNPILSMARGMKFFAERKSQSGELRLQSIRQLNQYCFFVAGIVGEILTNLVKLQNVKLSDQELENAIHFGFFLQKINILKDQLEDERHGRFFVSSRELVQQSLEDHARKAFEYVVHLPERLKGFRLFCSWSLFLGLASIPWIEQSWKNKKLTKIPRVQTQMLLWEIEKKIGSNSALKQLFSELFQGAAKSLPIHQDSIQNFGHDGERFDLRKLYSGQLTEQQLAQLGVAG